LEGYWGFDTLLKDIEEVHQANDEQSDKLMGQEGAADVLVVPAKCAGKLCRVQADRPKV
jgi:hypothetical protein